MVQDNVIRDLAGAVTGAVHGVVDQNVQLAQSVHGLAHQVDYILGHRHIRANGDDASAGGVADLSGGGSQVVLAAGADGHRAPFPSQSVGNGFADSLAPSGDQRGLAFQSWQHDLLLSLGGSVS